MTQADRVDPWGLTAAEQRAMRAYIEHGNHKLAARALGLSAKTVESHGQSARAKMGMAGAGFTVLPYIAFDRWDRGAL